MEGTDHPDANPRRAEVPDAVLHTQSEDSVDTMTRSLMKYTHTQAAST